MKSFLLGTVLLVIGSGAAFAQSQQPYTGLQARPLKALSEAQIADLRAGRGMTLALAAELNGYPGPLHVIELADALALTPDQRTRMQALYQAMKAEAVPLGEQLITEEAELDRQFASHVVTEPTLIAATAQVGQTQATLRATHLRYHLLTVKVLTPEQMRRYAQLRGYENAAPAQQHHPGMH
jgi:Spy/CpxP family protein refolding chaperone